MWFSFMSNFYVLLFAGIKSFQTAIKMLLPLARINQSTCGWFSTFSDFEFYFEPLQLPQNLKKSEDQGIKIGHQEQLD